MNKITFCFLITTLSGLSTIIGTFPIFFNIKNKNKIINISLSFASGVMTSISLLSLTKESYNYFNIKYTNTESIILMIIYIFIGFILTKILTKIFDYIDNNLYKLGIINMIALVLHNIPEGILTFSTTSIDKNLGISLAFAIILHNIPEGISISIPIFYATNSKIKAIIYTIIAGFSEILGALLTYIFFWKYINYHFIGIILSLTIGIMLYISLFELLKSALKYNKRRTIIFFLLGIIFMFIFK